MKFLLIIFSLSYFMAMSTAGAIEVPRNTDTAINKIMEPKQMLTIATSSDVTAVWRGFTHEWVNAVHRAGVIGNWIKVADKTNTPKDFTAFHWAQSGSVPDSASFSSRYNLLRATNTRFFPGKRTIPIWITEGREEFFSKEVVIPRTVANELTNKEKFSVLLNGFRIEKDFGHEAKKLGLLELEVTEPTVTESNITFVIKGRMMASCKSGECWPNYKKGEYDITVFFNVVASMNDQFNSVKHDPLVRDYPYDSAYEISESLGSLKGEKLNPIPAYDDYAVNVLGIRKFRFYASKDVSITKPDNVPHLYKWKMWVKEPVASGASAGETGGKAFFAHSKKHFTNVPHTGNARIEIEPITLQFKNGDSKVCNWSQTKEFGNSKKGRYQYSKTGTLEAGNLNCL